MTVRISFEANISKASGDGCWLWTGCKTNGSYGMFRYGGRRMGAHRAAFLIYRSEIPAGLWVLHRCDIPSCVNPKHLFLGTPRDNTLDKISKGRANWASGE